MTDATKADVFIVESLDFDDEKAERFEGRILAQILHLGGKKPIYYYIRTLKEFEEVASLFGESDYRYLHLSCHGSNDALSTTLDRIPFHGIGTRLRPYLNDRRLFISAFSAVNTKLAKEIFPESGCRSLIGPRKLIRFDDAAISWATFYHMMFRENPSAMKGEMIRTALHTIDVAYGTYMSYYTRSDSPDEFERINWKSEYASSN